MMKFEDRNQLGMQKGIYAIKNIKNDKLYIGQTRQPFYKRYQLHDWQLRNNKHENPYLQSAYNKYGEDNFIFIILEIINSNDNELFNNKEILYIAQYKKNNKSYNILNGGGGRFGCKMKESTKRLIGAKNAINNLGKKASIETKTKMSISRKGKHIITSNTRLNPEIVRIIKEKLIKGEKPSDISKNLSIEYRLINNILSNNAWNYIFVDGWDEWQKQRKRSYRLSSDKQKQIYIAYKNQNISIKELSQKYNKHIETIRKIIKKFDN